MTMPVFPAAAGLTRRTLAFSHVCNDLRPPFDRFRAGPVLVAHRGICGGAMARLVN